MAPDGGMDHMSAFRDPFPGTLILNVPGNVLGSVLGASWGRPGGVLEPSLGALGPRRLPKVTLASPQATPRNLLPGHPAPPPNPLTQLPIANGLATYNLLTYPPVHVTPLRNPLRNVFCKTKCPILRNPFTHPPYITFFWQNKVPHFT